MRRVLVTGGRDYADEAKVEAAIRWAQSEGFEHGEPHFLAHGGADTLAGRVAKRLGWHVTVYPAQWDLLGRAAGPMRNAQMLRDFCPDFVLAFPGGRGTADMVRRAIAADVLVWEAIR